jgi:hypothetical protein
MYASSFQFSRLVFSDRKTYSSRGTESLLAGRALLTEEAKRCPENYERRNMSGKAVANTVRSHEYAYVYTPTIPNVPSARKSHPSA